MKKTKKTSKVKTVGIGLAALVVIGAALPSEETPNNNAPDDDTSIVQQQDIEKPSETDSNENKEPEQAVDISQSEEKEPEQNNQTSAVDPEQAFRESLLQYKYVGSSESDKIHVPTCRWTKEINDQNLVHFDTKDEASAAGYVSCGTCHP